MKVFGLNLELLHKLSQKPLLFERGETRFWNDPYISQQMLAAHLNPDIDAASRRPEVIERTVKWVIDSLHLQPGDALLDLGCGPGLYARRFTAHGLRVTGVDISETSIQYARQHDPATRYTCQNYLTFETNEKFNIVTLIFGDFNVLDEMESHTLLDIIRGVLHPGGYFVFDVTTQAHHERLHTDSGWYVELDGGFWKPGAYMVLTNNYRYPQENVAMEQYLVIEEDGKASVYRNWYRYYSPESITALLEGHGFTVHGLYGDLTGTPYDPNGEWIGVVAQKPG